MKKILYSVFMLATMVLAACSSDDTTEPDVKGSNNIVVFLTICISYTNNCFTL